MKRALRNKVVLLLATGFLALTYNACDPFWNDKKLDLKGTIGGNPVKAFILGFSPARAHVGCLTGISYLYDVNQYHHTFFPPQVVKFNEYGTDLGILPMESPATTIYLKFGPGCISDDIDPDVAFESNLVNNTIAVLTELTFMFSGFYDPAQAGHPDLAFNFQNFANVLEQARTEFDILTDTKLTTGSFGPMTDARIDTYERSDTHTGCLLAVNLYDAQSRLYNLIRKPEVVFISPGGTKLGQLGISPGVYTQIEMIFVGLCSDPLLFGSSSFHPNGGDHGYKVVNSQGTHFIHYLVLKFTGEFRLPEDRGKEFVFDFGPIVNYLSTVESIGNMGTFASDVFLNVPGTFRAE